MDNERCPYCQTPYSSDLDENGNPFCDCEGSRIAELEAEIARLREAQRWIPVGERLPEEYGAYIGWNGEMYIGFTFGDWSTQCPEGVTHWKMLPQTPQEDDNENNR